MGEHAILSLKAHQYGLPFPVMFYLLLNAWLNYQHKELVRYEMNRILFFRCSQTCDFDVSTYMLCAVREKSSHMTLSHS